jgi:hypothetical protein
MGVTDLAAEVARFIHWNEAKDRRERNWDGAWKRWCDDVPSFSGNRTGQLSGTGGGVMGALKRIHLNSTENHDE